MRRSHAKTLDNDSRRGYFERVREKHKEGMQDDGSFKSEREGARAGLCSTTDGCAVQRMDVFV